jgi:hypothetical protein
VNDELRLIYQADQADRRNVGRDRDLPERDRVRRERVDELIAAGAVDSPDDWFRAAMVFQHGSERPHFWRAHLLARRAADAGHAQARWLVAASYDRWLLAGGQPQHYGTQYLIRDGRRVLADLDPRTTDAERALWDVPPPHTGRPNAEVLSRAGRRPGGAGDWAGGGHRLRRARSADGAQPEG